MTIKKQPDDAQHRVECAIDNLDEIQIALEAEKVVSHAKGYISALRYSQLIEHEVFKPLDAALDTALSDWRRKHDKL